MFFYEPFSLAVWAMIVGFVIIMLLMNEITRRYKWCAVAIFIVLPIVLTIFVWPRTAVGAGTDHWFAWVKVYSALAGVVGFMAIRYFKKLDGSKFMYIFPPLILAINILQAVFRDIEIFMNFNGMTVVENNLTISGGPWNLINAIAGILCIITITGGMGIQIAKTKSRDMVWPDMLWMYIVAYTLWNFAYVYNALADRSLYAGMLILISAAVASIWSKGAWLQHRAHTLSLFAMFNLAVPAFAESSIFAVTVNVSTTPNYVMSILSIVSNVALAVYMLVCMIRRSIKNPYTNDVFSHLQSHKNVLTNNNLG